MRNFLKHPLFVLSLLIIMICIYCSYQQIVSFSFVDEFNTIVAAYFMKRGRELYSQIFFNHQVLLPYISYSILSFLNPTSLYKLILYHRLFILVFSVVMDLLLIFRFRTRGALFVILYEPVKYFYFGNLFLAESLIIYPLYYLFVIAWESLSDKNMSRMTLLISAIGAWVVIFLREPYLPLTIVLYGCILIKNKQKKDGIISLGIFILFSIVTLSTVNFSAYFSQLFLDNAQTQVVYEMSSNGTSGLGIIKIFFYPFAILTSDIWSNLRIILIFYDVVFLFLIGLLIKKKKIISALFIIIILGLAGIRIIPPGVQYYGAYRMLVWFALFIGSIVVLLDKIDIKKYKVTYYGTNIILSLGFIISLGYLLSANVHTANKDTSFTTNYGHYYAAGDIIHTLSNSTDKVFIDGWDSLVYWQADRDSAYKYVFYYPINMSIPLYVNERTRMLKENLVDFYYTGCGKNMYISPFLPKEEGQNFIQVYFGDKPMCLYINKRKISSITNEQRQSLGKKGFIIPHD